MSQLIERGMAHPIHRIEHFKEIVARSSNEALPQTSRPFGVHHNMLDGLRQGLVRYWDSAANCISMS